MGQQPKVSIIVPVYNVEAHLTQCLDSLTGQTWQYLEIILVNDGSIDGSYEICRDYARRDNRIRLISKANGGLSDARNKGLDAAEGAYILLVDSDDYIEKNAVSRLVETARKHRADVVVCNYDMVSETGERIPSEDPYRDPEQVYETGTEFYREGCAADQGNKTCNLAWGKLYRGSLFQQIRYPVGRLLEDEWTTYKLLAEAGRTVYVHEILCHYRIRRNSIMTGDNPAKFWDALDAFEERVLFFKERQEWQIYWSTLNMLLGRYIVSYYTSELPERRQQIYQRCKALYQREKGRISSVKRTQYILFLSSPGLYRWVRNRLDGQLNRELRKEQRGKAGK